MTAKYFLSDCEGGGNEIIASSKEEAIKKAIKIIANDIIQYEDDCKITYHLYLENDEDNFMSFAITIP